MDRDTAQRLIDMITGSDFALGRIDLVVSELQDPEWKVRMVLALGDVMGLVNSELLSPIVAAFPDLDPDRT